jgi:hypothetical protein
MYEKLDTNFAVEVTAHYTDILEVAVLDLLHNCNWGV